MTESNRPAGEQGSAEREEQRVDTVPPPPGDEDAYSADTVIRDIPREALDAIRDSKQGIELRKAMEKSGAIQPSDTVSVIPDDEPALPKSTPSKEAVVAENRFTEKKTSASEPGHAPSAVAIAPPVTGRELVMAFAAAVVLIIVGFYVIGSAF